MIRELRMHIKMIIPKLRGVEDAYRCNSSKNNGSIE
jgi:hypothetical protein